MEKKFPFTPEEQAVVDEFVQWFDQTFLPYVVPDVFADMGYSMNLTTMEIISAEAEFAEWVGQAFPDFSYTEESEKTFKSLIEGLAKRIGIEVSSGFISIERRRYFMDPDSWAILSQLRYIDGGTVDLRHPMYCLCPISRPAGNKLRRAHVLARMLEKDLHLASARFRESEIDLQPLEWVRRELNGKAR